MKPFNLLLLLACVLTTAWSFHVAPPAFKSDIQTPKRAPVAPLNLNLTPIDPDEEDVRVDLVDDVDSFSLTAVGFGLIAFNFLVLANLGDGGVGGLVARFINFWNS